MMATITLHDDLAQQLQSIIHDENISMNDLVEELLALYQANEPTPLPTSAENQILDTQSADTQAYIGSLGSMCSVGEGNLSALSTSFHQIINDEAPSDISENT